MLAGTRAAMQGSSSGPPGQFVINSVPLTRRVQQRSAGIDSRKAKAPPIAAYRYDFEARLAPLLALDVAAILDAFPMLWHMLRPHVDISRLTSPSLLGVVLGGEHSKQPREALPAL